MVTIDREPIQEKVKRPSALKLVLHAIFVKNIGYKVLSVALSVALWVVSVGL